MGKRYKKLSGSTAFYPFGARTEKRAKQRRQVRALWAAGVLALGLAAALALRQTVFRGGQPEAPASAATESTGAAAEQTAPLSKAVQPVAATRDALAATGSADAAAHASPEPQPATAESAVREVLAEYQALYRQNTDLVGWLCVEGAGIDLPVMQTPGDNEYYLRRGFDRLYSTGGTLFLDERCSLGPDPSACWLIYGHNMADGSMFGQLTLYRDADFCAEHPTFSFNTLYERGTWQVVAALDTALGADELPYYTFFDADSAADWQARVDAVTALALYDTGVTPHYGDQLLILSTCGDRKPNTSARFALLAVRVG